jgi:hypothetical protein
MTSHLLEEGDSLAATPSSSRWGEIRYMRLRWLKGWDYKINNIQNIYKSQEIAM